MIPIAKPDLGEEEIQAANEVMRSGMIASGAQVKAFEAEFADYCKTKEAVAVNSGTSSLHSALLALGINRGDEVIVPSFTFIATASSVSLCGAKPVMADVFSDTYNINPDDISGKITKNTKAIIGVHLFGQAFDIDPVLEICDDDNLFLIEDCAQAHGAEYKGKKVGSMGDAGCFSFYPTKNMTTGEGGMITTDSENLANKTRKIINHGQTEKYLHTDLGYNMRMTDISAAIGRVQLSKIDRMNNIRKRNADYYDKNLNIKGVQTPFQNPDSTHVYHMYAIKILNDLSINRNDLLDYLADNGIGAAIHYPMPVHRQPIYHNNPANCPVSEELSKSIMSIPIHPLVTTDDCRYICEKIREAV
jgi:perosamine synthetase